MTAIGKPYELAAADYSGDTHSPLGFLKPLHENLDVGQWTLFDLRPLRANVRSLGTVAADLKRFMFGYDLLVVYREGTPSRQVQ